MNTTDMVLPRSNRPETRNPLLLLPVARRFAELPPDVGGLLALLLSEFSSDCRVRAERSWKFRKPPLVLYWAQLAVIARHIRLLLSAAARDHARKARTREAEIRACLERLLSDAQISGPGAAVTVDRRTLLRLANRLGMDPPPKEQPLSSLPIRPDNTTVSERAPA